MLKVQPVNLSIEDKYLLFIWPWRWDWFDRVKVNEYIIFRQDTEYLDGSALF